MNNIEAQAVSVVESILGDNAPKEMNAVFLYKLIYNILDSEADDDTDRATAMSDLIRFVKDWKSDCCFEVAPCERQEPESGPGLPSGVYPLHYSALYNFMSKLAQVNSVVLRRVSNDSFCGAYNSLLTELDSSLKEVKGSLELQGSFHGPDVFNIVDDESKEE